MDQIRPMKWMAELATLLTLGLLGALTLGLIGAVNTGTAGLVAGLLLASLPVPLYVLLALWIDRYEKEPLRMLWRAFLWGATGAALISLLLNSLLTGLLAATYGEAAADLGGAVLFAPAVEEVAKSAMLFFLFFRHRHEFDNVVDGILYATMVGLGFATMENVSYYGEAFQRGPEASLTVFVLRGLLAPFAHPFFTAMTGIGLGIARETPSRTLRLAAPVAGLAIAIFAHATWNLATGFGALFLWMYLLVMAPAFVGVVTLVLFAQARERRVIHDHLLRYAAEGVLEADTLETWRRWGGRTRTLWRALRAGGAKGWRREARLHRVASELAFHHWRLARGISRGAARDTAFEQEHLQQLRLLRPVARA